MQKRYIEGWNLLSQYCAELSHSSAEHENSATQRQHADPGAQSSLSKQLSFNETPLVFGNTDVGSRSDFNPSAIPLKPALRHRSV